MNNDPLLAMKQREMQARESIASNPVRREQIRREVDERKRRKKEKAREKERKRAKKERKKEKYREKIRKEVREEERLGQVSMLKQMKFLKNIFVQRLKLLITRLVP